jgi:membrane fusion protein
MNQDKVISPYRPEAQESHYGGHYGSIILYKSSATKMLTVLFFLIGLSIIVFFTTFSTTRKIPSQGIIIPSSGLINVTAPTGGVVTKILISEGQEVASGDLLFILENEKGNSKFRDSSKSISLLLESRKASLRSDLRQATEQNKQQIENLNIELNALNDELAKAKEQHSLQEQRVNIAKETEEQYINLVNSNYISPAQLQDKRAALIDQKQRLADFERQIGSVKRQISLTAAKAGVLEISDQREQEATRRNIDELEQEIASNHVAREIFVRAHGPGRITAITANLGKTISADSSIATIIPKKSEMEAEIYATSRTIGFIEPGSLVMLRYHAYPYQKFGQHQAKVREISGKPLTSEEVLIPISILTSGAEPLYRVRLTLPTPTVRAYGKDMPLKSGMLIDASVRLEKRKLYEWVLEPLYAISGRM